ncbi:MAG: DUF1826 domain-containing protein [Bacteroidota bacterium]
MLQTESKYVNAAIGSEAIVLKDIHLTSKNISIYQRDISSLNKELDQIANQLIKFRAEGSVDEILAKLKDHFNDKLSECTHLFDDISNLLELFEKTTESSSFRILFTTVSTNMCRKFHTDVNDLRLLCTYVGPGTLWIPDEVINHNDLPRGKEGQEKLLNLQEVQKVNTGDVVILKGALYPGANPILHRSPSIEELGEKRLLLRIDTNSFLKF